MNGITKFFFHKLINTINFENEKNLNFKNSDYVYTTVPILPYAYITKVSRC